MKVFYLAQVNFGCVVYADNKNDAFEKMKCKRKELLETLDGRNVKKKNTDLGIVSPMMKKPIIIIRFIVKLDCSRIICRCDSR